MSATEYLHNTRLTTILFPKAASDRRVNVSGSESPESSIGRRDKICMRVLLALPAQRGACSSNLKLNVAMTVGRVFADRHDVHDRHHYDSGLGDRPTNCWKNSFRKKVDLFEIAASKASSRRKISRQSLKIPVLRSVLREELDQLLCPSEIPVCR